MKDEKHTRNSSVRLEGFILWPCTKRYTCNGFKCFFLSSIANKMVSAFTMPPNLFCTTMRHTIPRTKWPPNISKPKRCIRICETFRNNESHICNKKVFEHVPRLFLNFCLGVLVSPKINHVAFLGGLDTSQNPKIMKIGVSGL